MNAQQALREGFEVACATLEDKLDSAKSALDSAKRPMRRHPWTSVGIAVAAGALLGFLVAKR